MAVSAVSNNIRYLLATKAISFSADTFKIALLASGQTFDVDADDELADVTLLTPANGYDVATLANVDVSRNDTANVTEITWNNVSWLANGGSIGPTPGAIIYDDTVANDPIVGYIDFGGEQTEPDGGTATIANIKVTV